MSYCLALRSTPVAGTGDVAEPASAVARAAMAEPGEKVMCSLAAQLVEVVGLVGPVGKGATVGQAGGEA